MNKSILLKKFESMQNWNKKLFLKELEKIDLNLQEEYDLLDQSIKDTKLVLNKLKK